MNILINQKTNLFYKIVLLCFSLYPLHCAQQDEGKEDLVIDKFVKNNTGVISLPDGSKMISSPDQIDLYKKGFKLFAEEEDIEEYQCGLKKTMKDGSSIQAGMFLKKRYSKEKDSFEFPCPIINLDYWKTAKDIKLLKKDFSFYVYGSGKFKSHFVIKNLSNTHSHEFYLKFSLFKDNTKSKLICHFNTHQKDKRKKFLIKHAAEEEFNLIGSIKREEAWDARAVSVALYTNIPMVSTETNPSFSCLIQ